MRLRTLTVAALALGVSCGAGSPEAINYGADECAYCRMQISDPRFGASLVTARGKTYQFDSVECLLEYYKQANRAHAVASVWVSDYRHPGQMLEASTARFITLDGGRSPMGRGLAAVGSARDAAALGVIDAGAIRTWTELQ